MPQFKSAPKTALDDPKLGITGDPWVEGDFKTTPKMQVRSVANGVRITAYLNHPEEAADLGPLNVNMSPKIVNVFLAMLEDAIAGKDVPMIGITNKGYTFFGGKRSDKPADLGQVFVSKNGDGEICIVLTHPGRKTTIFPIRYDFWYTLVDKGNNPLDKATASRLVARGWLRTLDQLLGPVVVSNYHHPEPKPQQGGYNQNQNSGGSAAPSNVQQQAAATTTDIFDDML